MANVSTETVSADAAAMRGSAAPVSHPQVPHTKAGRQYVPMAARTPLIVMDIAGIETLLSQSTDAARRLPREGVIVDIPELDEFENRAFQTQIKRHARACGCAAGAATFLFLSAILMAFAIFQALQHAWGVFALTILAGAIGVAGLTLAAKSLSLRLAHRRFKRECTRLIERLS